MHFLYLTFLLIASYIFRRSKNYEEVAGEAYLKCHQQMLLAKKIGEGVNELLLC